MALSVEKQQNGKNATLSVRGEITIATAQQLEEAIAACLNQTKTMIIDMEGCNYISSAGLRVLLSAYKKMKAQGGTLSLIHPNETVEDVLNCTGLGTYLFSQANR